LAPGRLRDLAKIGFRALVAATLACLMTAAVAGTFATGGSILLGHTEPPGFGSSDLPSQKPPLSPLLKRGAGGDFPTNAGDISSREIEKKRGRGTSLSMCSDIPKQSPIRAAWEARARIQACRRIRENSPP